MKGLFRLLWHSIPRGRLVRNVFIASSGHFAGLAIVVAATPILTRYYEPTEFGVFGVYMALLGILGVVSTLRYETAISLPKKDLTAASIVVLSVAAAMGVSIAAGGLAWIGGAWFGAWHITSTLRPFLYLFLLNLVALGAHRAYAFWVVRCSDFAKLAHLRLTYSLAFVLTQIVLGLFACGTTGLVMGPVVGYGCGVVWLAVAAYRHRDKFGQISPVTLRDVAIRYRRFPLYSTSAAVFLRLSRELPPLLLAGSYSMEVAGWYALAQRVVASPLAAFGNPISKVYMGAAARIHREETGSLRGLHSRALRRMTRLTIPPLFLAVAFAPWAFSLLFGPEWREAGVYCQILAPMMLVQVLAEVFATALDVLEKQHLQLFGNAVGLLLAFAGVYLTHSYALPPRAMLSVLSGSSVAGNLIVIGFVWASVCKADVDTPEQTSQESITKAA